MLKQLVLVFTLIGMAAGVISTGIAAETDLAPQVSNERSIKVTVAPQNLSKQAQTWDFAVTLETHVHPLNDDIAKSSTLIADGKQYAPLMWEGAPPGGHHRKGSLRFRAITPRPQSVELQIRLTGENAARSFLWTLNIR